MMAAYVVLAEAILIGIWGLPDLPEGLYGISFSCCVAIFFSSHFFATLLSSWVPSSTHLWSSSEAAYDRVQSAGSKAWIYVLGIVRDV
jgi:hypothetical protein